MANFDDQVMGLTGLTISGSSTDPSQTELSQFLNDGVIDVISKWIAIKPQDASEFARESSEQTSNASLDLNGAQIVSVIREDGVTSNNWRACKPIGPALQYLVTDVNSLHFASKFHPVYMIGDNGKISVFPAPGSDPDAFKVYYVNNSPEETDGTALVHSSSGIKYFPDNKVYLVVLYASIKSIQAKMAATTISDLSITAVPPDTPSSPNIAAPNISPTTVGALGTAPTLTAASLTTRVSFEDFWEAEEDSNPFGDNDPGALSITAVPPDSPTLASVTFSSLDSAQDATLVQVATSNTLVGATSAASVPTFTKPTVGGTADELTDMTSLDDDNTIDVLADQPEFDQWFATLAHMIEDEEDTELAGAQIQKISTYIGAYQAEVQVQLNEFNEANTKFQVAVQESMAEFQQANQIAVGNAERTQNRELQNRASDMNVIIQDNQKLISKYQSDLQVYQADVSTEVQEYSNKLQRYTTEMNTAYQAWAKTESDSFQKYQLDIQANLNEFNEDNVIYQSTVQKAIQDAQFASQVAHKEGDLTFQATIQDYTLELQKYTSDLSVYQADVGAEVQEYTQNLQADGVGYQWLQDQYSRLKAEYDQAFMIAAPKQPAR